MHQTKITKVKDVIFEFYTKEQVLYNIFGIFKTKSHLQQNFKNYVLTLKLNIIESRM